VDQPGIIIMKAKNIQVKTWGRTGSNTITNYFSTVGYQQFNSLDKIYIEEHISTGRPVIVHDHSIDYIIPQVGTMSMIIFLKRRDKVKQLLSMALAKKLKFFHDVDQSIGTPDSEKPADLEPFTMDKKSILSLAREFTEWHWRASQHLMNRQVSFITLYYEDYIDNIEYFNFLHFRDGFKLLYRPEQKNSLQAKELIVNYEEVMSWLTQWRIDTGIWSGKDLGYT
jgi:LPS sulfotransferase NodH